MFVIDVLAEFSVIPSAPSQTMNLLWGFKLICYAWKTEFFVVLGQKTRRKSGEISNLSFSFFGAVLERDVCSVERGNHCGQVLSTRACSSVSFSGGKLF